MKILFVCTGNTCRSNMAEALAGRLLEDRFGAGGNIEVCSAGLAAEPEEAATPYAVEAMAWKGIDMSDYRASLLTREMVQEADLVLTMTRGHLEQLNILFPGYHKKAFTLADFAGSGSDIADPIGQSLDVYRQCACCLEELISRVLDKLVDQD
jgi:protein-tyrosine-phosphatase